jgi:exopolysaccharide biosynthesis polyprenyl glycosylphosphotransferase
MKNNASLIYGFFLVIGDFLALVAAFVSAFILRVTLNNRPTVHVTSTQYLKIFLLLLPFWLIIFALLGLYNKNTYENRFAEFGRLIIGSFIGILFVISYSYITNTAVFPARLVTVYGFLLALCFMLLFRTLARAIRRGLFSYGIGINHVLIVGDTLITAALIKTLSNTSVTGYKIAGVVSKKADPGLKGQHIRMFDTFSEAVSKLKGGALHSIIQTELYSSTEMNSEILTFAQENHVGYRFVPGNSELFVGNIEVDLFHSIPVIAVHQTALIGWGRIVKRLFDVSASFIFIVIAAIPMLLIAILLKLSDPKDKILYKPKRLGRYGTTFSCYKFRSMKRAYNHMSPEEGFAKMGRLDLLKAYRENGDKLDRDPRVSHVGRIIRTYSLDELPQLFNVLKGDISLVGPRALDHFELDQYEKKNLILSVKSGITGLAVISGRSDIPFEERRRLDLYYVQNWSFWGDLVILARTFSVVIFHRGAR